MNLELLRKVLANGRASEEATLEAREITRKAFRRSAAIIRMIDRAESKKSKKATK